MPDQTLVSVMVPLYNHRDYVGQALDSLLAQDHRALEIVVVDDGSSDGGPELVERDYARHGVRLLRQRRNGCGTTRALNTALAACRGDFVCWLSADDWFLPHKVSTQLRAYRDYFGSREGVLHAQPGYQSEDQAYARANSGLDPATIARGFAASGHVSWHESAKDPPADQSLFYFLLFNYVNGITVFAPRDLLLRQGGFGESFPLTQDYELWARLAWRGVPFHVHPEALSVSRMHAGNLGRYRSDVPAEKVLIPRLYALLAQPEALAAARTAQGFGPHQHALFLARVMDSLGLPDQTLYWLERQRSQGLPQEWQPVYERLRQEFAAAPLPLPGGSEFRFLLMLTPETLPGWRWYFCLSHYFEAFTASERVRLLIWIPAGEPEAVTATLKQRLSEIEAYLQRPLSAAYSLIGGSATEALAQAHALIPVGSPDARESRLIGLAQRSGRPLLFHAGPAQLRAAVSGADASAAGMVPGPGADQLPAPARPSALLIFCAGSGWTELIELALSAIEAQALAPDQLLLVLIDQDPEAVEAGLAPWLDRLEALSAEAVLIEGLEALASHWPGGPALGLSQAELPPAVASLLGHWPLALTLPDRPQDLAPAWRAACLSPALPPPGATLGATLGG